MKYLLLIVFGGMLLFQCRNKPIELFTAKEVQGLAVGATLLTVNPSLLEDIVESNKQDVEISIPIGGKNTVLQLQQQDLFTSDFQVHTDNGQTSYIVGQYYVGKIKDVESSLVSLNIQNGEVTGIISTSDGDINIGKAGEDHVFAALAEDQPPFTCENGNNKQLDSMQNVINSLVEKQVTAAAGGNCVTVDFEFSYSTYTTFGNNVTNATNWFNSLFSAVKSIYTADGIDIKIKSLYFNTTPDGYSSNPSEALTQFLNKRRDDPAFTANLMHFIRVQSSNLSGVAYVSVVCVRQYRAGVSQLGTTFQPYPTYSWPVMVVAHELFHQCGSQHTHDCVWVSANGTPNSALDNCYQTSGGCPPGPAPIGGGTIPSYCHMTSYGISLIKGFGKQPGDRARAAIAQCSNCVATPPTPTCTDGILNNGETSIDCGGPNCPSCPTGCVPRNVSQGKFSTQSSTYDATTPASDAVDGSTTSSSFNHTGYERQPWWQVDLGSNYTVSSIELTHRTGCTACTGRIKKFRVFVTASPVGSYSTTGYVYEYTSTTGLGNGQVINIPNLTANGRYVKVYVDNGTSNNWMHFAEIKVMSCTTAPPCTPRDTTYRVWRLEDSIGTICR